jgi:hypothetical protein
MARRRDRSPAGRRRLRLFHHPQRGSILAEKDLSRGSRRYRGGADSDWREVAGIEAVQVNGELRPSPAARPPKGFLWGDPDAQTYGMGGPELVFGPLDKVCRDCRARFVFSAREQKHLVETRRLFIDATTVRCARCRRARVELERARKAYAAALRAAETTPTAAAQLAVACAVVDVVDAGGRASLDRAVACCRRARKLGAKRAAARVEEMIASRRR